MKLLHQKLEKQSHNKQSHEKAKPHGQALIEVVLILPIALFLFLFTIQIALLYNSYLILNYATYCGARAGAVHFSSDPGDFEKASNIAKKAVRVVLIPNSPIEAFLAKIEVNIDSKTFTVRVNYPAKLLIKLFGLLPNINIQATSKFVIERNYQVEIHFPFIL